MKKRAFTAAVVLAAGLAVTACSGQGAQESSAAAETTAEEIGADETTVSAAETEETSKEAATEASTDAIEINSDESSATGDELTGVELKALYQGFGESVQIAVKDKSLEELAELMTYPSYIGVDGGVTVNDEAQLSDIGADKIFTDELVAAVENADIASIEVSEAGFVIGDPSGKPNITLGLGEDGTMGITGINY
ncbi:MAG: hypothetical protein Q4C63_04545 [Eubacteriales bacterium]|nr:hypothetical protein [Eubacteriales bacterium]